MNYVWEVLLESDREGISREEIRFVPAMMASPYTEVAFENLNTGSLEETQIEINPLYRFGDIFAAFFDINLTDLKSIRETAFDISMHYLAQLDLRSGLDRQDYYIRFMERDINNEKFGGGLKEAAALFTREERQLWLFHLLHLYRTGNYREIFKKVITGLYKQPIIYENNDTNNEMLIFLGIKETGEEKKKMDFLISLFLPMQDTVHLFFEHHFGIIGIDETMVLGDMVLF